MTIRQPRFETYSETDILRQAEALRNETIRAFFAGLFGKTSKDASSFPANIAAAE